MKDAGQIVFEATHVITTKDGRKIFVEACAEDGNEPWYSLYTETEARNAESSDWTLGADGVLYFQGSLSHPMCDGASYTRICRSCKGAGRVFVGWGRGWEPCPSCDGEGK